MQVILKEDIASLGYKDDVVTVKDGYGRNYLIPQGLAVIASASALKVLAENKKQRAHKLARTALSMVVSTTLKFLRLWLLSVKKSTVRKSSLKILSKKLVHTTLSSNCTPKYRLSSHLML